MVKSGLATALMQQLTWCFMRAFVFIALRYVYECHEEFAALPTFGVIPAHPVAMFVPLEHYIPNYDRVRQ
jgi:hypothetical protein